MKARYEVTYHVDPRHQSAEIAFRRVFRTRASARKCAERMNERHCHETRGGRRIREYVAIQDLRTGDYETLDAVLVPSVGELGY